MRFVSYWVNQSAPSGPVTIDTGRLLGVGRANSRIAPVVEIGPIPLDRAWVKYIAPSGPRVIPCGPDTTTFAGTFAGRASAYSTIWPLAGLILPILSAANSVNQSWPSGPAAMFSGPLFGV